MTTEQPISTYLAEFANPSNSFRPRPLFVLNDEYETGPGEKRLTELLENLARVGYGGVFLHPRPGLITEYLSAWNGSLIEVVLGEKRHQTYGPGLEYAFAATDPEEFAIEITGLPFNLLGPFHKPDLLPKHGWGIFWHGGDVPNDPQPGEAYCLKDFGLFQLPTWSAG